MKHFLFAVTTALTLALTACANTADYQTNVNLAQITNTSLLKLIDSAVLNKQINKKDATNLLKQVDVGQEGIDVANTMDGAAGADKLKQAQGVLRGVRDYLVTKGVK